jgi:hypothetical protein
VIISVLSIILHMDSTYNVILKLCQCEVKNADEKITHISVLSIILRCPHRTMSVKESK